jgi:myo-inositol-hexaphosphate 3-phosphohydrolase
MIANTKTTAEKVSIAATFLSSNWDEATQQCVYRDDSTQDHYICNSAEEMVELYDLITDSDGDTRRDAYSIWCSQTSHDLF